MTSEAQRNLATLIRADRQVWRDLVAEVGGERMLEPGPMGEWTFKDMAAHLAAWRNIRIPQLEAAARGEAAPPPDWPAGMDEDDFDAINDWFQERDRDRPLDEVLADYDGSFERLAAAVEAVPEDLAGDANAFPWMDGTPLEAASFSEHLLEEHLPAVRRWLDAR